jgi:hypothetical protein
MMMSKYNESYLTVEEMERISALIKTLEDFWFEDINVDHIQVGDVNGEIIGKIQLDDAGKWVFMPRKYDKPGVLGE